ncbi:hypothetical protein [Rhodococcus qingshengii]|uniref:hypothetical protein n=1 Tax=Rhodococcus qingshengii TaxID=334542 RepID=UPI0035DD2630
MPPQFPTDAQMAQAWKDAEVAWRADDAVRPTIADAYMKLALGKNGSGLVSWLERNKPDAAGGRSNFADILKAAEKLSLNNTGALREAFQSMSVSARVADQYLDLANASATPLGSYANILRETLGPAWSSAKAGDSSGSNDVEVHTNLVDFRIPDEDLKTAAEELGDAECSEADLADLDEQVAGDSSFSAGVNEAAPAVARRLNISVPQARAVICKLLFGLMIGVAAILALQDGAPGTVGSVVVAGFAGPIASTVEKRWPDRGSPSEELDEGE